MRKLFAQCYYTFFVNGMMSLMIGSIMPFFMEDYHISYRTAGLFLSLHSIGNLLASFVVGFLIIRIGRKKTIVALSSFIGISFLGIITTQFTPLLGVLFLLTGLGRGSVSNTNNAIINDAAVGKASYLNILHTFFAVGAFLTPFAASLMIGSGHSWKTVVGIGICFSVSMFVVYCFMKIENSSPKVLESSEIEESVPFYKNIDFYIAAGVLFFYLGAETSVNGWLVTYLKDTGIMTPAYAQALLSVMWIVIIIGRLLCAYLAKYMKKTTIILINSCGTAVMFLFFFFSKELIPLTISVIGFGFFFAGIYPTTIAACGKILKGSGAAMGAFLAIAGLGGIIAPYIIGFVASAIDISAGMYVIIVSILFTIAFSLVLKVRLAE